ncbi:MFS transporter [Bartonella rattaustraliani]|uniref:MFS transporter n=1 Tax=Bartonella rattaustraliani TaxID=481139 RepID=UPI001FCAC8D1|nr:MFS transporter [Bartonella rattaustraliani]
MWHCFKFCCSLFIASFWPFKLIETVFYSEAVLIALAAFSSQFGAYIILAAVLGSALSMLWSAVLVIISDFAESEQHLDWINRIVQSLRNFGYVGGPLLGSVFFNTFQNTYGMIWMAIAVLLSGFIMQFCLKKLKAEERHKNKNASSNKDAEKKVKKHLDLVGLFGQKAIVFVLIPLIITIVFVSAEGVLFVVYVRKVLHFDATVYGFIVSAVSVGLVLGPLLFAELFKRFGYAPCACFAATLIGLGVFCLASTINVKFMFLSALLIGIANGVQNTLMASFMMQHIPQGLCKQQMPAYIFILQTSVLVGFIGGGFIDIIYIQTALIGIGIISMSAGMIGAMVNFYWEKIEPA